MDGRRRGGGRVLGEDAGLVALHEQVVREAAEEDDADEEHRAPLQVPVERLDGVVDLLARPDQVQRHPEAPQHRQRVDDDAPLPEREVARVVRLPRAVQAGAQHRHGDEQVRDVDHHDPDARDDREDLRLVDVDHEDEDRQEPDEDGRDDRRLRDGMDAREMLRRPAGCCPAPWRTSSGSSPCAPPGSRPSRRSRRRSGRSCRPCCRGPRGRRTAGRPGRPGRSPGR